MVLRLLLPKIRLGNHVVVARFARVLGSLTGRADVCCTASLDFIDWISVIRERIEGRRGRERWGEGMKEMNGETHAGGVGSVALVTDWTFAHDAAVDVAGSARGVSD